MSVEDVKRIDERALAAWGDAHDVGAFLALCADDILWRDVSFPEPLRGKAAVQQYMQGWLTAFPDIRAKSTNRVVTEDSVACEIEWSGTNNGPLQGPPGTPALPPTGKRVNGKGAYFARVGNGKIVEFSAHPDMAGTLMQLGIMPSPGR